MENASKALLIAGGVLLAMMILAIMVYVFGSMSDFAEAQNRQALTKEITEFNRGYEAYNKKRMYGIDIITVVNKAIYDNRSISAKETDPYYINVIIKVNQSFETTANVIDTSKSSESSETIGANDLKGLGVQVSEEKLEEGKEYKLGEWKGDTLDMNEDLISYFGQVDSDTTKVSGTRTYYIHSALTNFKKAIFECTSLEYSDEGRICQIRFEQK